MFGGCRLRPSRRTVENHGLSVKLQIKVKHPHLQDTEAVQHALRRCDGNGAINGGNASLQALVTPENMAWAAATLLSRGFNLQQPAFDGALWSLVPEASAQPYARRWHHFTSLSGSFGRVCVAASAGSIRRREAVLLCGKKMPRGQFPDAVLHLRCESTAYSTRKQPG